MTAYEGYLSFGGNEVVNTQRAIGIQRTLDCPTFWLKNDWCPGLKDALNPPSYGEWTPVRANACQHPNAETASTVGWASVGAGTSVSNTAAESHSGTRSYVVTANGAAANQGIAESASDVLSTNTAQVAASLWAKAPLGALLQYVVSEYTAGNAFVATLGTVDVVGTGDWQRVSLAVTKTGVAANKVTHVLMTRGPAAAVTFWVDDAIIEAGSVVQDYFDGSTESTSQLQRFYWAGTANASTSVMDVRDLVVAPAYSALNLGDAPWYDLNNPDVSGRFYGVAGIDIIGLQDSTRSVQSTENITDGLTIGDQRRAGKRVKVRAQLIARGKDAMEYGLAWLDAVLSPGACGQHGEGCGTTDLTYFADCPPGLSDFPPDATGFEQAVADRTRFLHGVAVDSGGPFVVAEQRSNGIEGRLVEWTFVAERPWIYGVTEQVQLPSGQSTIVQDIPYNLVPYPSAELAGADVTVATNYSTNPSVETDAAGWAAAAAAVSGTSPSGYFTSGRTTELAAVGTASERARILGNGATEVAASVADVTIQQDVSLGGGTGARYSFNMWAAGLIAAGAAVSAVSDVKVEVEWRTASAPVGARVLIGQAADATERSGKAYSSKSLLPPATATIARVIATYRVTWRSSATPANNSDVRLYADALAVTVP